MSVQAENKSFLTLKQFSFMLSNKNQAQVYGAIERKGNSYHVNFYLRVSSRFANFFTAQNPAPARVAAQLACFNAAIAAEDGFFKISTKSDLTPLIQEWDTKRDNNTSSIRAMAQAYALNPGDAQKQADGQRVLDLMKHYAMSNDDNYENQGSKTLQFCQAIDASTTLTAAIANIGATTFYQDLKEANEQCRLLIDQRNAERAEAPQQNMVELRKRTDMEYRDYDSECIRPDRQYRDKLSWTDQHSERGHQLLRKDRLCRQRQWQFEWRRRWQ